MAPRKSKRERFPENGFEAWGGYMNAKMAKLEDQFLNEVEKEDWNRSNLFSGISIFVNGFTNPSADELKHIMAEHGGIYHHYFRSERTKFIIASNLPDTKVKNLPSTKIVKPEWISESIKAGTLLDYKEFLLYGNHSKTQPRLNFQSVKATPHTSSILPPAKEELSVTKEFHNDDSIICNTNFNESAIGGSCIETVKETEIKCLSSAVKQNYLNLASNKVALCDEKDKYSSTRTAVDPKFLSEYYSNSRLHHISQLGAGFKQYINELRDASDFSFPLREKLKSPTFKCKDNKILAKKIIMHIDMDCFFVSVGLRKNPHLRGQPVAVTHSKGGGGKPHKRDGVDRKTEFYLYKAKRKSNMKKNLGDEYIQELEREFTTRVDGIEEENEKYGSMSEIASCSYEARALGVHNGMFMGPALRLCPNIQTIPYDFEGYKEVAFILYNTVAQYTLDIEAVSCDEMYVDCTDLLSDIGLTPMHFAKKLRDEIKKKTGCPCSTGFGSNRLQARLATKKAKPDGQFYLQEEDVLSYFSNVSLGDLPGVGRQMECKLTSLGFTNCESLRSTELAVLQKHFGNKTGQLLFNYCRGLDDKPLNFTILRKSISAGVNYGIRFEDFAQCENFLRQLSQELCSRMVQNKVIGKALTFKLMVRAAEAPVETAKFMGHGFCDNITKTTNLSQATDNIDIITKEVLDLCKKFDVKPEDMRGLSIQASKLESKDKCDEKKGGIQNFLQLKARFTESEFHKNNKDCVEIQPVKESDQKTFISSQLIETFEDTCPLPKNNLSNEILTVLSNVNENISKPLIEKKPKSLGLTGKRRGRPPKNASLINNTKSVKNNSKTVNLFLSSHANKNEKKAYNFEDLDQECLNALPDDLKTEILANCKIKEASNPTRNIRNSAPKTPVKNIAIDPDYLAALPEEIRKEIETNPEEFANPYIERKPQSNISNKPHAFNIMVDDNILNHKKEIHNMEIESEKPETEKDILNLHWKDVREMLREWFKSTSLPMQCDIDMIMLYVKTLVMQKHIEDVDYLMKFFYRTMCDDLKDNCNWHRVYLDVIAGVQDAMLLVYKNKLKTDTKFSCCNF